ncbi:DUF3783 domain-containing protein [Clostridium thailandense]|uniref:DUF3783 domain-containing protein n=1 Tax=Clostridium thailandense TaxID=2794346 RepID=A0A949TYN6_9CLOT|nr:DUF3783 domain-containing protein [Clostridium thailandense]MBV7273298.1 DUF3783 domain-containing protein [Clostridium thailandense]MCH5137323.1 DUF3783 domain-containing protein [Clostridiaceae bacterium UIB06]
MLLENNKTILIFGFDAEEKQTMHDLVKKNHFPNYKVVEEAMGKMKIKDILEGLRLNVYNCSLPKEKVILFNNLNDEELDTAIKNIRNSLISKPILAVITETSVNWTFESLLEHLVEEREWFKKHGK